MKNLMRRVMRRLAPEAYGKLERLDAGELDRLAETRGRVDELEARVADLEAQLNETRMDHRRVVELYDAVFERLRSDNPLTRGR